MSAKRLKDLVQMRPALDQVLQHIKSNRWREARAAIDALQEPVKRGHRHNEPKNPRYPVFPEDKYIRALYRRVPAVRQLPIDLRAEERERTAAGDDGDPDRPPMTHFAKRFGLKQLELVEEKGMTEDAAFDEVWRAMEGELDAELDKWVRVGATVPRGPLMMVRTIQLEEEKVLREGLLQRVAEFGQVDVRRERGRGGAGEGAGRAGGGGGRQEGAQGADGDADRSGGVNNKEGGGE